jgi:DNA repair photolyase
MQRSEDTYFIANPEPRKAIVEQVKKELSKKRITEQVLLSFIGDCYCKTADSSDTMKELLEVFLENKTPIAILTKGGDRALKHLELFKKFGEHIQVGATLTFFDKKKSLEWESGAAIPSERLTMLKTLKENGIKTFASFEPVIEPNESLELMRRTIADNSVDVYKVGKLNNYMGLDKTIDWTDFLKKTVELLRGANKAFYIKYDLRQAAPSIKLFGNEVLSDEHNVY